VGQGTLFTIELPLAPWGRMLKSPIKLTVSFMASMLLFEQ
jgi:hypothetical protein